MNEAAEHCVDEVPLKWRLMYIYTYVADIVGRCLAAGTIVVILLKWMWKARPRD